jgi:hypothetical protein
MGVIAIRTAASTLPELEGDESTNQHRYAAGAGGKNGNSTRLQLWDEHSAKQATAAFCVVVNQIRNKDGASKLYWLS